MVKTLRLTLARHGETELTRPGVYYGRTDAAMTEQGERQVRRLAAQLGGRVDAVFASPLLRCARTAQLLAPGAGVTYLDGLQEIDFGAWEGLHYREAQRDEAAWRQFCAGGPPPGGESAQAFYQRVTGALDGILRAWDQGSVLVVSHHGCIRAMLAHLLGLGADGVWRFKLAPGGAALVEVVDGYAVLVGLMGAGGSAAGDS